MKFAVKNFSMGVHESISVDTVAVHLPVALWYSSVSKHHKSGMDRLWSQRYKVPEHIVIRSYMSFRISTTQKYWLNSYIIMYEYLYEYSFFCLVQVVTRITRPQQRCQNQ